MNELPSGTVTFLFTDIEGSTELVRKLGDRWGPVRGEHRRIIRAAAARAGGREVDTQGDSFFFVFARARDAVLAASEAQTTLTAHDWPDDARLRVRMGLHTGEPGADEEGYLGLDVVRGARICALAAGGQVLVSDVTRSLLRGQDAGFELRDVGERELKGLPEPERLYELVIEGVTAEPGAHPSDRQADIAVLSGGAARLADRLRESSIDLGAQIQEQVAAELRKAGVPGLPGGPSLAEVAGLPAKPSPPPAGKRGSLAPALLVTVAFAVIAGVILVVLLLVL